MTSEARPARLRRGAGSPELYDRLAAAARTIAESNPEPADRLVPLCDALWDALAPVGLSWIGFYLENPERPAADGRQAALADGELLLAARRDKPACSPIGLHGVCGQSFLEGRVRLVEDVALLGPNYIACDPRDRSEVVVPVFRAGRRWGVLDADSHEQACFGASDIAGLVRTLRAAGLLDRTPEVRADCLQDAIGSL